MTLLIDHHSLTACGERLHITSIAPQPGKSPDILALHGLGKASGQHGSRYLLEGLARVGLSSISFDFSGHGKSGGIQEEKTLSDRLREARAVVDSQFSAPPKVLIGTSMGAYIALRLTRHVKPSMLVLLCPALYPDTVYDSPLDSDFRAKLGGSDWYRASAALDDAADFPGDILIIGGCQDVVTPPESFEMLYSAARQAKSRHITWFPQVGHALHDALRADREATWRLITKISQLLDHSLKFPKMKETAHYELS